MSHDLRSCHRVPSAEPRAVRRLDAFVPAIPWARLRLLLRDSNQRMPVNDSWIAATALSLGVPVVTQDDDYADIEGLDVIKV